MMKIPLRIISDYSLLKSLISLPKIIPFLKSQNIDACGICDDNLYGVMEFYDLCLQNQIKPIVGLNVPFLNVELAMYAKNYHGYQNLLKIHTIIQNKEEVSALDKKYFDDLVIMMDTSFITSYDTIKPFFDDEDFLKQLLKLYFPIKMISFFKVRWVFKKARLNITTFIR